MFLSNAKGKSDLIKKGQQPTFSGEYVQLGNIDPATDLATASRDIALTSVW